MLPVGTENFAFQPISRPTITGVGSWRRSPASATSKRTNLQVLAAASGRETPATAWVFVVCSGGWETSATAWIFAVCSGGRETSATAWIFVVCGGGRRPPPRLHFTCSSEPRATPSARRSSPPSRSASCAPLPLRPLERGPRTSRWRASSSLRRGIPRGA